MKHNITKFFTRLALVAGLMVSTAGSIFAQTYVSVLSFNCANASTNGSQTAYGVNNSTVMTATGIDAFLEAAAGTTNKISVSDVSGSVYWAKGTGGDGIPDACLKVGKASGSGAFTFTIDNSYDAINRVVITGYGWKNTSTISINSLTGQKPSTAATETTFTFDLTSSTRSFALSVTTSAICITKIELFKQSGSAVATTTTISDSEITNTDVYVSTTAGSLSATVKDASNNNISGASVTWSGNNDAVATINASTGAVTLVGAGSVTFTASYAGVTGQYQSSTATYNMTVTDSTPFTGGDVEFDATRESGNSPLSKNGVSFACDNGVLNNGSEYCLYKNSTTTFSVTTGVITSIAFTGVSGKPASGFANQEGWTTSGYNGTWTGSATSVSFVASTDQVRATKIVVTVDLNVVPDPVITAADVNIAYNIASGSIAYEVSNPVTGATLQATIASGATISNMTIGSITNSSVPFTCSANTETTARTATVTLNYVKNNEVLATKNVTVTQAAAPVIYSTIPALFAAATSTETEVHVTFNNWVVSGVSTNGKNVFVTDNSGNGFVIFDNTGGLGTTYSVGAILSGANVTCNLVLYNGFAEIKSLDPSDLNITTGGSVSTANIAMADLAGVNTGALVSYQDLVCSIDNNKYYLSDGTTTLQVYNAIYAFGALESGKHYNITGIYQQYNSTKEILPRSAADIEEVVITVPTITVALATVNATAAEKEEYLAVTYAELEISSASDFAIQFCNAQGEALQEDPEWVSAEVTTQTGEEGYFVYCVIGENDGAARTAYFKVWALDEEGEEVYSNLVTVTQAAYVVDYAELPFEWAGGTRAELGALVGVTTSGLGSDYAASNAPYRVKLDGEGDYILIKTDSRPGKVSIGVKMLGGTNTSKIKVQGSADGETFTDVEELTISGSSNTTELNLETSNDFAADARYVKIIKSVHGSNIGVGPITITQHSDAPSIVVTPASANPAATDVEGTLDIEYENLTISDMTDFGVQFCDSEGTALTSGNEPTWIEALVAEQDPSIGTGYVVSYIMDTNEGDARSAYFKVFALGTNDYVYSNLVTITQAAQVCDYASLPFTYDGDCTGELPTGLTQEGLGEKTYTTSPKISFNTSGDWLVLKMNEAPSTLSFDIKGNGFSNGTFKVQTSADGVTYTDLETYTELDGTIQEEFNLSESVRYIRWIYTEKVNGNVALGNIEVTKKADPESITLNAKYYNGRYWATFFNGVARYILPEGAQAFTMNASHQLYRLGTDGSVIPANTAVVILVDPETSTANTKAITLNKSTDTDAIAVHGGTNILEGFDIPTTISGAYVLGIVTVGGESELGFFPYNGTGDNAKIPANKAYYVVSE